MMRKLLTLAAFLAVVASQSLLTLSHATSSTKSSPVSSSNPGHALSMTDMLSTQGKSVCDNYQCNNTNGCVDFGGSFIYWTKRTQCAYAPYGICNNFANDIYYHKVYFKTSLSQPCTFPTGGTYDYKVDYCSNF